MAVEKTRPRRTAPEPLTIVVTNDDGIGAEGIDVLVTALMEMDDVEVHVVAPAGDMTGQSDNTTPGGATFADGSTISGVEGTAVDGFPADTINVALDDLGLEPDLVVSGINKGQNVGPLAYLSGTVGAGREAVRRGIPAIAGSAGLNGGDGYELATELIVEQIDALRDELSEGTADTDRGREHQRAGVHGWLRQGARGGSPRDRDRRRREPVLGRLHRGQRRARRPTMSWPSPRASPPLSLVPPEAPAG